MASPTEDFTATDAMALRVDTSLACMNFGAGYYEYHTLQEYVVPEEMDNAAAMGIHLIGQLGTREYVIPYASRYKMKEDPDYDYFLEKFKREQIMKNYVSTRNRILSWTK